MYFRLLFYIPVLSAWPVFCFIRFTIVAFIVSIGNSIFLRIVTYFSCD